MRREKKVMNRGCAKSEGYNRKKIVAQVGINEMRQLGRKFQEKKKAWFLSLLLLFLFVCCYFVFAFASIHRNGSKSTSRLRVETIEHMPKFLPLKSARNLSFLM